MSANRTFAFLLITTLFLSFVTSSSGHILMDAFLPAAFAGSPPSADAGPDQTVKEGDTVTLDGSASSDPDDDIAAYSWDETNDEDEESGAIVELEDDDLAVSTFEAPEVEGTTTLTFELTVFDEEENEATDTVEITVENIEEEAQDVDISTEQEDTGDDATIEESQTEEISNTTDDAAGDSESESSEDETDSKEQNIPSDDQQTEEATPEEEKYYDYAPSFKATGSASFDIPDNAVMHLSEFTVAAWFRTEDDFSSDAVIISKGGKFSSDDEDANNINYAIWVNDDERVEGGFENSDGTNYFVTSSEKYNDGKWHYAVVTYDGATLRLFIDGEEDKRHAAESDPDDRDSGPLVIGANPQQDGNFFTGEIDEVRLWDRALSAGAVEEQYASGTFDTAVVVYMDGEDYEIPNPASPSDETEDEENNAQQDEQTATDDKVEEEPENSDAEVGEENDKENQEEENNNETNDPPIADAGEDLEVDEGETVSLDGSDSHDADGTILLYSWIQTEGEEEITLPDDSGNKSTLSFTAPNVDAEGDTLEFELFVLDNDDANDTDSVQVEVKDIQQEQEQDSRNSSDIQEEKEESEQEQNNVTSPFSTDGKVTSNQTRATTGNATSLPEANATDGNSNTTTGNTTLSGANNTTSSTGAEEISNDTETIGITSLNAIEAAGGYNYSPSFVATGSKYFDIADNPALRLTRFTLATWFNTSKSYWGDAMIVNKIGIGPETPGNNLNYGIWMDANEKIRAGFETSEGLNFFIITTNTYNDGAWHYAVVTYDGSAVRLFIDGAQIGSKSTTAIPDTGGDNNYPLRIGANSQGQNRYFTGEIDEVRVWNRALSAAEIADQYNSGVFDTAGQVAYMDGVSGSSSPPPTNQAPISNAGPDQVVTEGQNVVLNGTESSDADNDPLTFSWTQTAGPAVILSGADTEEPTFTAPTGLSQNTTLTFELNVADGNGGNDTDTTSVLVAVDGTVIGANQQPIADAGSNQTVAERATVILNGSGSSDPDDDALTYSWSQIAGSPVSLSGSNTATPTFEAPNVSPNQNPMSLVFELTVQDGNGGNDTDVTQVVVENTNQAPIANAGPDQVVNETETVTLDGSSSSDPDQQPLQYSWKQIDNSGHMVALSNATSPRPTFVAPQSEAGSNITLAFMLTVSDGSANSSDITTATVYSTSKVTGKYNYAPAFTATGSNYFDIPDNPSLDLKRFSVATWFKTSSTYSGDAMIVNKNGLGVVETSGNNLNYGIWMNSVEKIAAGFETVSGTNYISTSVDAYNDGKWHYAVVTYGGPAVILYIDGVEVARKSSNSINPDSTGIHPLRISADSREQNRYFTGEIDEVRVWNRALSAAEIADQYNSGVFDTAGQVAYMDGTASDGPPVANAGPDQTVNEGAAVTLDGSGSSDPDGDTLTYSWSQTAGPAVTLSSATAAMPTFTAPFVSTSTTLTFALVVNDGKTNSNSDTVNIIVSDTGAGGYTYSPSRTFAGDNYIDYPSSTALKQSRFTLSAWFKTSNGFTTDAVIAERGGLVGAETSGRNINYGIWMDAGEKIRAGFETSGGANHWVTSPSAYSDGNWHYAVVTYDGSNVRLYIDGVQVASLASTATPDTNGNQPLRIGSNSQTPDRFFKGEIDEVHLWSRAVTAAEVSNQFGGGIFNANGQVLHVDMGHVPLANAGPTQSVAENSAVDLDGTSSIDPDGSTLTYSWTQVAGPGVTLSNANTANPSFTAPAVDVETALTFRLVVGDGQYFAADSVKVYITNDGTSVGHKVLDTPDYVNDVSAEIDKATSYVYVGVYYLEHYDSNNKAINALENAVDRGVTVRVIFDPHSDSLYPKTKDILTAKGIPYKIIANHAKLVVIDDRLAYIGSANWNRNGLVNNYEMTLRTDSPTTISEVKEYLDVLWTTGGKVVRYNDYFSEKYVNGMEFYNELLDHVRSATSIEVLVYEADYNFANPNRSDSVLLREFKNAHDRGAEVQLVLDNPRYDLRDDGPRYLYQNNVPYKVDDKNSGYLERLHPKAVLFDNEVLFIGSQNWTYETLTLAQEGSVITRDVDTISQFQAMHSSKWTTGLPPDPNLIK